MRSIALAAGVLLVVLPKTTLAQYPNNGYIGVFADPLGTQPCLTAMPFQPTQLYVVARPYPAGITGAEFRLELSRPDAYIVLSYTPVGDAAIVLANPIDITPCDEGAAGTNIAFTQCQLDQRVALGTITILNIAPYVTANIRVKARILTDAALPALHPVRRSRVHGGVLDLSGGRSAARGLRAHHLDRAAQRPELLELRLGQKRMPARRGRGGELVDGEAALPVSRDAAGLASQDAPPPSSTTYLNSSIGKGRVVMPGRHSNVSKVRPAAGAEDP